jgi:hypothetical protein
MPYGPRVLVVDYETQRSKMAVCYSIHEPLLLGETGKTGETRNAERAALTHRWRNASAKTDTKVEL